MSWEKLLQKKNLKILQGKSMTHKDKKATRNRSRTCREVNNMFGLGAMNIMLAPVADGVA